MHVVFLCFFLSVVSSVFISDVPICFFLYGDRYLFISFVLYLLVMYWFSLILHGCTFSLRLFVYVVSYWL